MILREKAELGDAGSVGFGLYYQLRPLSPYFPRELFVPERRLKKAEEYGESGRAIFIHILRLGKALGAEGRKGNSAIEEVGGISS